jgi:hypothetical protein
MNESWSPRCHKCGARGNAVVTPSPNQVFAGRLRPEATKPFVFGTRVRCTKCRTWFTLGPGTEWRINPGEAPKYVPEPVSEEGRSGDVGGDH